MLLLNAIVYVKCESFEKRVYFESIKNENTFHFLNPGFNDYLRLVDLVLSDNATKASSECTTNLRTLRQALVDKEEWALQIYESNGSPKNGFLSGLNHDIGNLDQCLRIDQKFNNQFCLVSLRSKEFIKNVKNERTFKEMDATIQYQLTKDLIEFSFGTVIGTCLPKSCDKNILLSSINKGKII